MVGGHSLCYLANLTRQFNAPGLKMQFSDHQGICGSIWGPCHILDGTQVLANARHVSLRTEPQPLHNILKDDMKFVKNFIIPSNIFQGQRTLPCVLETKPKAMYIPVL